MPGGFLTRKPSRWAENSFLVRPVKMMKNKRDGFFKFEGSRRSFLIAACNLRCQCIFRSAIHGEIEGIR